MSSSATKLAQFIQDHQPLTVITGAGCSAASGIPTYRDDAGTWQRSTPIQHQDFLQHESVRKRYWARSANGWPMVAKAQPNQAHAALAGLEKLGLIQLLITQNVDRLHQRSGHQNVIDLHGRLDRVQCLDCYQELSRDVMQDRLLSLNPDLLVNAEIAPDGDADVSDAIIDQVQIPHCVNCAGILKPQVVFYGGGVNPELVQDLYQKMENGTGLLVLGSSLMVFSSYRFCRFADKISQPIAIVNCGTTRADDSASLKLLEPCEDLLPSTLTLLTNRTH